MGSVGVQHDPFSSVLAKYESEKQKRQRSDGLAQYINADASEKFKHYAEDPWIELDNEQRTQPPPPIADGGHTKVLILGAGYAALTFAVRFIEQAGFKAEDFVFVDTAGGFGGVWYWNRYPGLMCDVESACYLPLLEETRYRPKNKYAYGPELKAYAELVAAKWNLQGRGLWQSTVKDATWDEEASEWVYNISRKTTQNQPEEALKIRSDFFIPISGLLTRPKLPNFTGLESFNGHMFHTARWDYKYTGGSSENPALVNLEDKSVAFLGTGATGVQAIPALAKWAKKLYVIQRTPASVAERGQRPIDPDQWKKDTAKKGWQLERRRNMASFLSNDPEAPPKIVDDGWTVFPSYSALVGGPLATGVTGENLKEYIGNLLALDFPRQEAVRARVDAIVRDRVTAEALKPWYPGWCKRPGFHDEYLQAFNLPNIELVDTDGKGVEHCTKTGIIAGGKEFDIDVLILGTGFEPWSAGSPAYRAHATITGRGGLSLDQKWHEGIGTLHGVFTRGFPNMFLPGTAQTGASVNYVHMVDGLAQHAAYVLAATSEKAVLEGKRKVIIEPTEAGEMRWTMEIVSGAYAIAGVAICTPSYLTAEGALTNLTAPEDQLKIAEGSPWSKGLNDFERQLEAWRCKDDMEGLEARVV
ncbi:flavin-binding monooxygenase-like family protein [Dactylonectria estremocensis]|uniref:Flavin-binding monooxygenase-like family protein n=1 Tax=Dactylonectria estremocensis TaxID=1079267 RepID=A0A9P9DAW1_9HYPO|nr:flavin-binding monooxygenase-like family protein [Dactylonectria estremocensis]